jgi:nucleoside-diphosphate-sugar epimerase
MTSFNKMTILVIGSNGYIGSKLVEYLKNRGEKVVEFDYTLSECGGDVNDVQNIDVYNVVIYLAAHSGVAQCSNRPQEALINNVTKFINFTKKLNKHQKFIYMSSASVYGNTNGATVDESYELNESSNVYDFTKQIIDEYMLMTDLNYYGLRLGTVNGCSNNIRNDLIINSMVNDALQHKHVRVFNGHVNRAIVDIYDLCRLISVIINAPDSIPGIYNVASFNTTVQNIANVVSELMNVDIIDSNCGDESKKTNYDFSLDTTKIKNY